MTKNTTRRAFTLIEVMVAVMIISVVISALWKMKGDATQKFFTLSSMAQTQQYASFLLGTSQKYGFDTSSIDLKTLADDFDLESDVRRKLKAIKVKLSYEQMKNLDSNESVLLEIGTTTMQASSFAAHFIRVRLQ